MARPTTVVGTASNFARYLRERRGPIHTAVGIAEMRLGLRVRSLAHHALYLLTRDPERLYKANKTRQFLAHGCLQRLSEGQSRDAYVLSRLSDERRLSGYRSRLRLDKRTPAVVQCHDRPS